MSRCYRGDPSEENGKRSNRENCEYIQSILYGVSCHKAGSKETHFSLQIQYENSKPTLLENGSALTRIVPIIAGMYINTPAYARPIYLFDASLTPSQIVRTTLWSEMPKECEQNSNFQPLHPRSPGEWSAKS